MDNLYDEIEKRTEDEVLIHLTDLKHINLILENEMMMLMMKNGRYREEEGGM
jgi:hypothetical protein